MRTRILLFLLVAAAALALPPASSATYSGSNGVIAFRSNCNLWLVNPDGSGARQFEDFYYGICSDPRWSPDGHRLSFSYMLGGTLSAEYSVFSRRIIGNGERAQTLDGVATMVAGNKYDYWGTASWSPDGNQFVVTHDGGLAAEVNTGLYIVSAGGFKRQLTDSGPTWNPDGRTFYESPFHDSDPVWSPDGKLIAFIRTTYYSDRTRANPQLMVINPHVPNATPRTVVYRDDQPIGEVDWSPDGSKLVYSTGNACCTREELTGDGIWTVRPDGTDRRRIYPSGYTPAFSPDGSRIVFSKYDGLYVMPAGGGANNVARRLFQGRNAAPDWQRVATAPPRPTPSPSPPPAKPVEPPPLDRDGDRVVDTVDGCPAISGDPSNRGCPVGTLPPVAPPPDRDGDGVIDIFDGCPSIAGAPAQGGCPLAQVSPPPAATPTTPQPPPRTRAAKPRGLSAAVVQLPGRRLRVTGSLRRPSGVPRSACNGTVLLQARRGRALAASRRTALRRNCTYRGVLRLRARGRVVVSVRYLGNARLTPHKGRSVSLRVR